MPVLNYFFNAICELVASRISSGSIVTSMPNNFISQLEELGQNQALLVGIKVERSGGSK